MAEPSTYPWFGVVRRNTLEEGDLLNGCPRFVLPPHAAHAEGSIVLTRETVDAVILSQACDLAIRADGECEAPDVLLCPIYFKKDLRDHPAFWEEIRQGRWPFFHILNECGIAAHEQDFVLVDFQAVFTLSVPLVREFAAQNNDRLRLLPPYREHLSQAFARLFVRVGPTDVPPSGKRKQ